MRHKHEEKKENKEAKNNFKSMRMANSMSSSGSSSVHFPHDFFRTTRENYKFPTNHSKSLTFAAFLCLLASIQAERHLFIVGRAFVSHSSSSPTAIVQA